MLKIIVGREPESRQLKLKCGKTTKLMGNPGSVPNSVSREHVAITVDEDADRYFIENMKPANEVLVNGISVMRREVGLGDMINLGGDRYPVRVSDIVGSFVKEKVDISHLQWIWDEYDNFLLKQQTKNQRVGLIQRASGLLTTGAILIGGIQTAMSQNSGNVRDYSYLWLYALAAAVGVGMLIWSFTQTKAPKINKIKKEQFLEQYACPKCGISFGMQPYKQLITRGKCYNCGVQFKKIR